MNAAEPIATNGAVSPASEAEAESSLPLDPMRLLGGIWKRKLWILIALAAGTALGFLFGEWKARTRYLASVQLIKKELPSAFRVGEVGEAFRPHEMSGGTLVGAASSAGVLQRVAARTGIPEGELEHRAEVAEQTKTDFVMLTISGYDDAYETARLANIWAKEVVDFTRDLQSGESHEMRVFLQTQVDSMDSELRKVNDQILDFTRREDLVDADKQITEYLRALSEIDLKYETARIELDTIAFKIKGVETELRRQSPLAEKLRAAQAELEELRAQYTDKNPIVLEKMEKVKAFEAQMDAAAANKGADPSTYAGTFLGNTLYLDLIQYQNEQKALNQEMEAYDRLRTLQRTKLNSVPEKAAEFAQLGLKRQSLQTARGLLYSRLREAQLFEESAPGYYRIFTLASAGTVVKKAKLIKTVAFAAGGGITFGGLAFAMALLFELIDPKLRTGWEAGKAMRAPLLASIPKNGEGVTLGSDLWSRWIGSGNGGAQPRIVWSPSPGNGEERFWSLLFERASTLLPSLLVVDCGSVPLPATTWERVHIERIPTENFSIADAHELGSELQETCKLGGHVWIRLAGPVHEPLTTIGRCGMPALVVVPLNEADTEFWKKQGDLLTKTVGRPAGVVTVGELPWHKRK